MPTERKRKLGNPGRRPLPDSRSVVKLAPAEGIPVPPRPLSSSGLQLWERSWKAARTWLSPETDIEMLLLVCERVDERTKLRKLVMEKGDWRDRSGLRALEAQIAAGLSMLGFTPVDRTRMGVGEIGQPNELDEFRRRSAERNT